MNEIELKERTKKFALRVLKRAGALPGILRQEAAGLTAIMAASGLQATKKL